MNTTYRTGRSLCRREHRGRNGVHRGIRKLAEAMGFIVPQQVDEPGLVGVMRFAAAEGGATQFATCDGRWVTEAPAGAHSSLTVRRRHTDIGTLPSASGKAKR